MTVMVLKRYLTSYYMILITRENYTRSTATYRENCCFSLHSSIYIPLFVDDESRQEILHLYKAMDTLDIVTGTTYCIQSLGSMHL